MRKKGGRFHPYLGRIYLGSLQRDDNPRTRQKFFILFKISARLQITDYNHHAAFLALSTHFCHTHSPRYAQQSSPHRSICTVPTSTTPTRRLSPARPPVGTWLTPSSASGWAAHLFFFPPYYQRNAVLPDQRVSDGGDSSSRCNRACHRIDPRLHCLA